MVLPGNLIVLLHIVNLQGAGRERRTGRALPKPTAQRKPFCWTSPRAGVQCETQWEMSLHYEEIESFWDEICIGRCSRVGGSRAHKHGRQEPRSEGVMGSVQRGLVWPHWLDLVLQTTQMASLTLPSGVYRYDSMTARTDRNAGPQLKKIINKKFKNKKIKFHLFSWT